MSVSVIIPSHNRLKYVERAVFFLNNWTKYNEDMEIIISDDNSDENIENLVSSLPSKIPIKFVSYRNKVGPHVFRLAKARNAGCEMAEKEFLLILDCDRILSPNYLTKTINFIKNQPVDCAVGGRTIYSKLYPEQIENDITESVFQKKEMIEENDRVFHLFTLGGIANITLKNWHNLYGGGIVLKKELFEKTGGYNEEYIGYGAEDAEFCRKIMRLGCNLFLIDILMYHMNHPLFNNDKKLIEEYKEYYGKTPFDFTLENMERYHASMNDDEKRRLA
jgi:GT2 family glycosyltransferase